MRALIIGGTGKVGGVAVRELRAAGIDVVAASRRGGSGDAMAEGTSIALDMRDPAAVRAAATGCDAAFFATPLGPDEAMVGQGVVAALSAAAVDHIVYLGIMNVVPMRAIPHFEAKIPVRQAVLAAGGTVIDANYFFQNDAMMAPAMLDGVYPMPVGSAGVHSVDVRDIGRAVARVILGGRAAHGGGVIPLCGPDRLTGPSMAGVWADALGRPVTYAGDDTAPFLAMMARIIPGWGDWEQADFDAMMRVTQAHGCPATPEEQAAAVAIVGRPLRRYADFVDELIKDMQQ